MCGIVFKRLGHNVHILEQYHSSERQSLAVGVGFFEHVQAFFKQHDFLVDQPNSILSDKARQLKPDLSVKRTVPLAMLMSSWDAMFTGSEPISTGW